MYLKGKFNKYQLTSTCVFFNLLFRNHQASFNSALYIQLALFYETTKQISQICSASVYENVFFKGFNFFNHMALRSLILINCALIQVYFFL